MRYAKIKFNDIANGPGVAVSVFLQGCDFHCKNCFNPETWDFNGGQEFTDETLDSIIKGLTAHDIKRHLALLGGEPLHPLNLYLTNYIITSVKQQLPDTKIYLWTGYTMEELRERESKENNNYLSNILNTIDILVDDRYIDEERDITLFMRGSKNQRIWNLKTGGQINDK